MERYLVSNYGNNPEAVAAGLDWLEENGGGVLAMDQKRDMERVFSTKTDKGFEEFKRRLKARGIDVTWRRDGWRFMRNSNVFALYPTKAMLEEIEEYKEPSTLYVLAWSDFDTKDWTEKYSPVSLAGGNERPDWA